MGRPKKTINTLRGKRLKEIRNELGLSQKEFADRIHISVTAVSEMENSHKNVTETTARATIKEFPEYNLSWLLGFDHVKKNADIVEDALQLLKENQDQQFRLYADMMEIIKSCGYEVYILESGYISIENKAIDKTVLLPFAEAREYFDELQNMIESFVSYHFIRHKKERS